MADVKGTSSLSDSILGLNEITENKSLWKMLAAEFIGTLILVTVGCGSCLGNPTIVQIALAFGLTVAALVQAIGHVSGGHINPAVTVSFFITGEINLVRTILFILVQCIGAIAGAGILKALLPASFINGNLGFTEVAPEIQPINGLFFELVFTFILVFVIHGVCDGRRNDIKGSIPLAIGLTVTAAHLSGIHFTGSSINPARTFGPSVVMNFWNDHWVYWVGPIAGGVLAGLLYKYIFKVQKGDNDSYDF
ncbi:aquaporin AQPAe.a [Dendroctonus ponderosae]|uniref:Aquaporin n=1 Tax=Dendroctonus ponderosae TaxID=77166 RepID=J3JYA8_DENPD|nr:aquaporin AQPAe.a [Dendroctonus ponderosae]AEE63193.1 unknown [Dendroctonus ponderosae]